MLLYPGIFMIIQPCPPQTAVIKLKAQGVNQMKVAAGIRTEAYDIARVRRDLRLI